MKSDGKQRKNKAVEVAVKKFGAIKSKLHGFVEINYTTIDLTASGHEDWQVAYNIIRQLA